MAQVILQSGSNETNWLPPVIGNSTLTFNGQKAAAPPDPKNPYKVAPPRVRFPAQTLLHKWVLGIYYWSQRASLVPSTSLGNTSVSFERMAERLIWGSVQMSGCNGGSFRSPHIHCCFTGHGLQ